MLRALALLVLMMWPVVPLLLIPLHLFIDVWRRIGRATYGVLLVLWLASAYLVYSFGDQLLTLQLPVVVAAQVVGAGLLLLGVVVHGWTARLLGWRATMGLAELAPATVSRSLVTTGPFGVVRHPTYLAHSLLLFGAFLLTAYLAVWVVAVLDLLLAYWLTIPLEERELRKRYGEAYEAYRQAVPKLLPTRWWFRGTSGK